MDRRTYIPALDGVRAVALLLVVAFHSKIPGGSGGYVGVDVFFVLSGFLITGILYREVAETGTLQFRHFYLRRFLRLTPPLAITIIFVFLVEGNSHSALRAAFYLNDLLYPVINGLNHTWSLAVEEHYYLIWPPVLLLILRFAPRRALSICAGLFLLAFVVRIGDISIAGAGEVYHRLDARFTGLMLGSTLAVFVAERHRLGGAARWSAIALVPMFALMPFNVVHSDPGLSFGVLFTEAATALVILSLAQGEAAFAFLAATPLRFIGRISYGAYLYHCPVMLWMTDRGFVWWSVLLVVLPLTTVFASLSYYYLERPLLSLARRRDTAARPILTAVAAGGEAG